VELASRYVEIETHKVHYWEGGQGFPVLMMHGVGPGTSIMGNFEPALSALSDRYHIFATDLIGFGDSARKSTQPYFDVDLWVRQGVALLDLMPDGPIGIAGHSLGGALALKVAAASNRVTHVLTSSTIGTDYPLNQYLDAFWSLPADRVELRAAMADMVFDSAAVSEAMIEGRWNLLAQEGYSDYFESMFAGDRQRFVTAGVVSDAELKTINEAKKNVLMIHGTDDKPCPAHLTTEVLGERIPHAAVRLIDDCGHNLPREYTQHYLDAAFDLYP
jgi:2-hydroxymuconate-semialdehyde hydrolase